MSDTIRLTVTDDQGILLDSATMTREEFRHAQSCAMDALSLLEGLSIGRSEPVGPPPTDEDREAQAAYDDEWERRRS